MVPVYDDERITAFGALVEAHRRLERATVRPIEEHCGLSGAEFEVLLRLGRSPGARLTMSELARQVDLTTGGATRLVDRVAAAGFVQRVACPSDRRVQYAALTPSGEAKLVEATTVHLERLEQELVGRLDRDELEGLVGTLAKLRDED